MNLTVGDPFELIEAYVRATVLYAEARVLRSGYPRSYRTFCRQLLLRNLRPLCEGCAHGSSRAHDDGSTRRGPEPSEVAALRDYSPFDRQPGAT